jgi:N-acetylglutamate synthase-like GNAT family acetyltransferase
MSPGEGEKRSAEMRFGLNGEAIPMEMSGAAASLDTSRKATTRPTALAPTPIIPLTQYVFVYPQEPKAEITGYSIGAIGRLVELHALAYHQRCGYDFSFEVFVARELGEFITQFNPACDGLWLYKKAGAIVGCVAIDGHNAGSEGARLRFLIVHPAHQGRGVGKVLMENAVSFCNDRSIKQVFLWTSSTLYEARQLYEKFGFSLVEERSSKDWGVTSIHQRFQLTLPSN